MTLLEQQTRVAGGTGVVEPMTEAPSRSASAHLQLGDPPAVLAVTATTREVPPYPTEELTVRLLG